jgi:plasmid maintenance system antidote protein VapI
VVEGGVLKFLNVIEVNKHDYGGFAMKTRPQKKSAAMRALDKMIGEPLTFGSMINTIRETDEYTLRTLAKKLGVSIGHVCDVEKGRRGVSPERAAKWARALGYPEALFVKLALQSALDAAGLKYSVELKAA